MSDPTFAAIDKHRRAREQHLAALADAEMKSDDRLSRAESDDEISTWDELLATKPTTLPGLQVFLDYIGKCEGEDDGQYANARDLLAAVRTAAEAARHQTRRYPRRLRGVA
jgi:hypothetical protein